MKKILLCSVLSFFIILVGCSSEQKNNIYGEYIFEEVSYLSLLSSSSKDGIKEMMKDSTYNIQEDLYKVQSSELNIEVVSPKYVKEEIDPDSFALFDSDYFRLSNIKSQYSIYDQDGNKTSSILFVSSNDMWITTNAHVAPNGQLVIFSIIKLSKSTISTK